jgi:hypothetical protein
MHETMRIIGSVLVRNEDRFVEHAIRNVAAFCDRIHAVDHRSRDGTWGILRRLAEEFDHLDVVQSPDAADSHRVLEQYAGTPTWVLGVDGDELYDPVGLARLRTALLAGTHADVFRLKAHVLNCDRIGKRRAFGYLSPPSRPITKLFNLAAVDSWTGCLERLHAGSPRFRPGYHWEVRRNLAETTTWESDPLRCLHVCFLPRSSRDRNASPRRNLDESLAFRRGAVGLARRAARRLVRPRSSSRSESWKREWYARGERVEVDVRPFLVSSG